MATALLPAFETFLEYLVDKATPEEILAFHVSPEEDERASELLERQSAGTLSPQEVIELDQMREFDRLVSLLKAKALAAQKRR